MRSSGDIGLLANNKLYYIQRKDNRVKILGKFVDLEQIENVAEEIFAVRQVFAFTHGKRIKVLAMWFYFLQLRTGFLRKT